MAMIADVQEGRMGKLAKKRNTSYLGLGLESRVPVMMSKGFHNSAVIVGRSVKKFTSHRRCPENLLPALRILVDVLPKHGQLVSLRVPEPTTYRKRHMSLIRDKNGEGHNRERVHRVSGRRTDKARTRLEVDIVRSIWTLFTCARPGHDEQTVISAVGVTHQAAEK